MFKKENLMDDPIIKEGLRKVALLKICDDGCTFQSRGWEEKPCNKCIDGSEFIKYKNGDEKRR